MDETFGATLRRATYVEEGASRAGHVDVPEVVMDAGWLQAVIGAVPHAVLAWDGAGRCLLVNEAAERLLEQPREALLELRPDALASRLLDRATAPEAARALSEAVKGEGPLRETTVVLARPSQPLPVRADVSLLPGGGLVLTLAVLPEAPSREELLERTVSAFLEHTPDPVVIHRRGHLLYANPAALKTLGYRLEEVQGRPVLELVAPADREAVAARIGAMITEGVAVPIREERFLRRDGTLMTALVAALPLPYHGEQAIAVIGHDMTALKKVEAERERLLRQVTSERALFHEVLTHVPAAIAVLRGPDFVFEHVNHAFQAFFPGRKLEGLPARQTAGEHRQIMEMLDHLRRTGEAVRSEDVPVRLLRANGSDEEVFFSLSCVSVPSGDGTPDRSIVMAVETTEQVMGRRRVEELARASQQKAAEIEAVLESMVDGVITCDAAGNVQLVNKAGRRLLGIGPDDEINVNVRRLNGTFHTRDTTGEPMKHEDTSLARALRGEVVQSNDCVITDPWTGRDVWLRVSAAPVRDAAGNVTGAVSVPRDVTDLIELDRLKDQFIRVAAHELKTPVTIIKGYVLTLLRSGADLPAPLRRTLDAIARGTDRIARIVTDLVDISQVDMRRLAMTREPVDLADLVQATTDRISLDARGHRIRVVAAEPLVVPADRSRTEQILTNLLSNAIRYSPAGGDVEVELRRRGDMAEVSVRDHGIGIPPDKQARIFERFYRAHTDTPHDYGGLGVGLHLSRAIVAAHGGRMWFESEEDAGSTFHFTLPLAGSTDGP